MLKILFVDDDVEVIDSIKFMGMITKEYEILTAYCAKEALDIYNQEENIPVVFTDIEMPEMNGIDLMLEIKAKNPNQKIVAITGHNIKFSNEDFWFDDVLLKPVTDILGLIKTYV